MSIGARAQMENRPISFALANIFKMPRSVTPEETIWASATFSIPSLSGDPTCA